MSTIACSYPDVTPVRRAPVYGRFLILGGLFILAIILFVVVISTSHADPAGQAAIAQNSTISIAVPVPTPPAAVGQTISTETTASDLEETSEPPVVAVPVPAPSAP
jgi:hypothetical protein